MVALPDGVGFDLWLKSRPDLYSIPDRENYPSIQSAVSIVAQFLLAGLSDSFSPYIFLTITQILFIISYSSLVYWDISIGYRWFCFMIVGFDSVNQAIVSGQINRTLRRDAEERAFVIGYSDAVSQAMNIWTNIVFFPTSQAPEFRNGYIASLSGAVVMLVLPIGLYFGNRHDAKVYALQEPTYCEQEILNGEIAPRTLITDAEKNAVIIHRTATDEGSNSEDQLH